ncbi:Rho GTPase, partial [Exophiala xenobiotica]
FAQQVVIEGEPNGELTSAAQVDNRGSLENVGTKWIAEINEHCPGVKIVLCALKCDLREEHEKEDDEPHAPPRPMIQYNEGLEVARQIGALRYLECSAMRNRGVNEAFTEAARVALQVKPAKSKDDSKCTVM